MTTRTQSNRPWNLHPTLQFANGTSFHDITVIASYSTLERFLGAPNGNVDPYKVSTEWVLVGPNGAIVTVYDWKATNLYDPDCPSPEALRAQDAVEWHIGGADGTDEWAFRSWLLNEMRNA